MTLRTVTSSGGQAQLVINYDGGGSTVTAGQVIDVPVGSALETAIGTANRAERHRAGQRPGRPGPVGHGQLRWR